MHKEILIRDKPGSWRLSEGVEKSEGTDRAIALFEFMEQELKILTKDGRLVLYRMNQAQQKLAQHVAWRWHNKLPVKVLVPKARQMGVSTFWQLLFFSLCLLKKVYRVATVAHDDAGARKIFSISKTALKHLSPEWGVESFPLESRTADTIAWEKGSKVSVYSVRIADALGKGGTIQGAHFSEAANFTDGGNDADGAYASMQGELYKDWETVEALESTAKGRDPFFYAMIEESLSDPPRNNYVTLFFPWFLMPEYSMPWEEYRRIALGSGYDPGEEFVAREDEVELRARLRDKVITPDRAHVDYRVELTDEQLIWRRYRIRNDCRGKVELFQRYYPSDIEEAFASTETTLFSSQDMDYYWGRTRDELSRGNVQMVAGVPAFLSHNHGVVRIWEHPLPGEEYVIGADVSLGKRGGDFSAAYVLRPYSLEVVAALHGLLEWDHYADALYALGRYYNWALLAIENNYSPATADTVFKKGYKNLYHYADEASARAREKPKAGFNTNKSTRPEMIQRLSASIRDRELIMPDTGFVREMKEFVYDPKRDRYAARQGKHDDRIMALSIALYVAPSREERRRKVETGIASGWDPILALHEQLTAEEEAEALRSGERGVVW